ncbi:MAG: hypothetical protein ACPGRZ_15930 [Alphaproteobacteria bacterium]
MLRTLAALSAVAVIGAGCSSVKIIDSEPTSNYYDGAFEFATQSGEIKTAIYGSPFDEKASDPFARSVTAIMKGANFGREVTYVPAARNTDKKAFHIVAVFYGVAPFTDAEACENVAEISTRPNAKTTTMHAYFCHGAYSLSSAIGFVDNLTDPSDPCFQQLVRQVAQAMIPRYDEEFSSGPDLVTN